MERKLNVSTLTAMSVAAVVLVGLPVVTAADSATPPDVQASTQTLSSVSPSPAEIKKLFEEAIALNGQDAKLLAEIEPLIERGKELEREHESVEKEKTRYDAACMGRPVDEATKIQCDAWSDQANKAIHQFNASLRIHQERAKPLVERQQVIRSRLARIQEILSKAKAFQQASDECAGLASDEAKVECMKVIWDGARDPKVGVERPGDAPVAVPAGSGKRTVEQAIEEYKKSGKAPERPAGSKPPPPPE